MIRVVPFIQTLGGEKYKQFLTIPFTIDMLYPVFGDKSTNLLFDGWRGKDMMNWHRFINDNKIVLEFYPTYYTISKEQPTFKATPSSIKYMLSIPKTIDDFINDMYRFNVELYWTNWIDENLEPKDYLHVDKIKDYYADLLGKMGKSHELL
jgi:hypothetical protein